MLTETIRTAARIVDPRLVDEPFDGTFDDALSAMVTYAADMRDEYGPDAGRTRLARALVNSQADRVAEVAAAALLRLGEVRALHAEFAEAMADGASSNDVAQLLDDWLVKQGLSTVIYA